jgi:ubiquinone/menaquinone biosynthesis C-methylase UbiE
MKFTPSPRSRPELPAPPPALLRDTQAAFDSVAADYDGPRGNNRLIQDMRREFWRWLDMSFAPGARLLDLGCGTGLDALRMAERGHRVTAADWSPLMAARTRDRAQRARLAHRIETLTLGAHELDQIEAAACFDGIYSNLGVLNCLPQLQTVSRECARLLKPGGRAVFTVIGRWCPWEIGYFAARGDWTRVRMRFAHRMMPVRMNARTVWTHYWSPRELYHAFARQFALVRYRGICVFAPPPYMTWVRERHPRAYERLWRIDRRFSGWPLLRRLGDHFLIVMERRPDRELR